MLKPVHATLLMLSSVAAATPTEILPLSGMGEPGEQPRYWDFRIDAGRGAGAWTQIRVPSCWEQEGFGAYYYGTQGRGKPDTDPVIPQERAEYRTTFVVPPTWRGRQVRIVFDAVMTDATVRINRQQAGPTHQGGFYRFHYDITSLVQAGARNELSVLVAKESANPSVNRAERRGDYWTFGGIYRPVWLESRPRHHIEWTAIDARADGVFTARVHLGSAPPDASIVRATIIDPHGNRIGQTLSGRVPSGASSVAITGRIDDPLAWSAETPHLYRVRFTLEQARAAVGSEPEVLHEVKERFGFRTFEVRPRDGLYLNGRKLVLKGVNRHSFAPATGRTLTREHSERDVRLIKEANMNAVRTAHYPPDRHFLQAADEQGLYVLHELAGWQGSYDTPTGARLIGQMVRRDLNHPSVLFWSNGNEGGWNEDNDAQFARWDLQRRSVLHPWAVHDGVNTDHYESYASTARLSQGPEIFMPTEFLHGLYDGGIGAGLQDYWNVMSRSPTVGGGFLWAFADEGLERTDQSRRIDNMGNSAPDGMVGPYREREGSFYAVKEIWSPVQIRDLRADPRRASLRMTLANRYTFTSLSQCTFRWRALRLPGPAGAKADLRILDEGEARGPPIEAGGEAEWEVPLDAARVRGADVLHLTVNDPQGRELWTWSAPLDERTSDAKVATRNARVEAARGENTSVVRSDPYALTFDSRTGRLIEVRKRGTVLPLSGGPRLVAYRRTGRRFDEVAAPARLTQLQLARPDNAETLATVTYDGPLRKVTWTRNGDALAMSYEIAYDGVVDVFGVGFEVPEAQVTSKRWLGRGPYRIWQNRLAGGVFDVHETAYNDPIPGETYAYPEFKGYFGEWRWLTLDTVRGAVIAHNDSAIPYFGLYRPRSGVGPVLELPDVGWSLLHVIPAIGTKFDLPDALGPQSQPRQVSGIQRGQVRFSFPTGTGAQD